MIVAPTRTRIDRIAVILALVCSSACTAHRHVRPYLRHVAIKDSLAVWIVDGTYIRDSVDEEFSNFGQHYAFSFIPPRELWLDREAQPDEQKFFVDHLIVERALMQRGMSYDSALDVADSVERAERNASGDVAKMMGPSGLPDPQKAHLKLWRTTSAGLSVWIVDGRLVRSTFDVDFTEGGHDHVYEFVPSNEVWIDNDVMDDERPYILLHELHERDLMVKGWTYDTAHEDSDKIELYMRHHPSELHLALTRAGWE